MSNHWDDDETMRKRLWQSVLVAERVDGETVLDGIRRAKRTS